MKLFWRASFGLVLALGLMATTASADTSLENEVDSYLAQNSGKWGEPATFRVFWKDGIKMESGDGNFTFHLRGRAFFDVDWRDEDEDLDSEIRENHVGFTALRIGASGTMYKNIVYKLEIDFADRNEDWDDSTRHVNLADVYIGLANLGGGTLLIGHMKQDFSLGEMTSSRFTTFIARAATVEAFTPRRNSGIQWFRNFGEGEKMHLAIGIFNRTAKTGNVSGHGGTGFNTRFGWVAIENVDKDMLLEVGVSFLWQNLRKNNGSATYAARPGTSMGPFALVASNGDLKDEWRLGFELAFRMKALHMQAEYIMVEANPNSGSKAGFNGWYVQIGYFITGESRPFNKQMMAWARVMPKANFWTGEGGRGAHEIAFRFDMTDMTDEADEGKMTTFTFGWNWYWNGNARMMVNYVYADIKDGADAGTGKLNAVIIRWQFDF